MQRSTRLKTTSEETGGDEGGIIRELRQLRHQRSPRRQRITRAMHLLEGTESPRVRNAAAVALADMRAMEAKEKLIALLTQPKTNGARGSLLYALDQLRATVPLPVLAEIISSESYEAREEALAIVAHGRVECSAAELASAKSRLEGASISADPDRLQAISEALKLLRAKHYHDVRRW